MIGFYTLIGTAKLNGVDPSFYLRTVLARIPDPSAKSDTAGAIRYALSHWRALARYVEDGLLETKNWPRAKAPVFAGFFVD